MGVSRLGHPELLDSYEMERRPVAKHNAARSADVIGTARAADEELQADLGGRIGHAWTAPAGGRVSTLDLLGPGLTLLIGVEGTRWEASAAAVRARLPITVRRLEAITARALGIRSGGALLARPNGAPAGWFTSDMDAVPALRAGGRRPPPAGSARRAAA